MRLSFSLFVGSAAAAVAIVGTTVEAFAPSSMARVHSLGRLHPSTAGSVSQSQRLSRVFSAKEEASTDGDSGVLTKKKEKTLGLITFDLDDTLYPVAPVLAEANKAFARAMDRFGYEGIQPDDIDDVGKVIRAEMSESDPEAAAILTHTEIRTLAIRRVLEKILLERMLQQTAQDWATDVHSLTKPVVDSAKKWARNAVPPSVVQAVYNAWEMERYHAAERYLYDEVIEVFMKLKQDYPGVIIGAVTDGKANPMLMTFTLASYFDFCMSWEDDQGERSKFYKSLASVEGNAELTWIYDAAFEKYKELSSLADEVTAAAGKKDDDAEEKEKIWIHVGDDLAYDVGGSAPCGARTILCDLVDEYGQTAKKRYDPDFIMPAWSNSPQSELDKRQKMNERAKSQVDYTIQRLSQLNEAVAEILDEEDN